ncbi:MAG: hypothetical protein ACK4MQ_06595 [Hyphomonas sp.]
MATLLRILGVLWCIIALLVTLAAVVGAMFDSGRGVDMAFAIGAFIGAGLVLSPVWLTGVAFFLLPGWIRKQLGQARSDTFA